MNFRPFESTLVVRFSAAKVDHVDEREGVHIAYDERGRIVDVAVQAKTGPAKSSISLKAIRTLHPEP